MNIAAFVVIILIILISLTLYYEIKQKKRNNVEPSKRLRKTDVLTMCQVPTLSMDKCLDNEYYKCPKFNGSYDQCTNNYIPIPDQNNCPCKNRTFGMCPHPFKISENVIHGNNPRINMWAGDITNDNFLIQCR